MDNNIDVLKQLEVKNHEIFINKLNIDLDNYFQNLDITIKDIINKLHNELDLVLDSLSIDNKSLNQFFDSINEQISSLSANRLSTLKNTILKIDEVNYEEIINDNSKLFIQKLSTFYLNNIDNLINELTSNEDDFKKKRLTDYLKESFYAKYNNRISETIGFNNKILINNYLANCERIESINQKTLK